MRSPVLTIFKKELARFFGDRRMALTTILLPGLMIYVLYTFMGNALSSQFSVEDTYRPTAVVENLPDSLSAALSQALEIQEEAEPMELVRNQKLDLYIRFPAGFDEAVAAYDMASGKAAPQVEVYYNSAAATSGDGYNLVLEILNQYESSLVNKFHVNWNGIYDLATQEDATGSIFSSMMPMLLLIFLFSGCMAVAPESIAGEKERGTIATLLITPTKRGSIALGKIMALSVISLLSGASSAIGTTLSLPKLMGAASEQLTVTYGVGDYALLGVVILSTVLLLITLISIVSAFAKSVKEAQTYVTPLMIVVILVGVTAMFGGGAKTELCYYLIPVYNSVQCMVGIFAFSASPVLILTAVAANLAVTGLGVFLLTRMFNSEGIMFSR
ncbi:MAG: ABC transporter permease subunit [Oscillospiraceae bacterium]|jgi:sodium transport system permease protein